MIEKFKQHWFISILLLCAAVTGATWKVAHELLVEPREFQIALLKEEIQKLKLAPALPSPLPGADEFNPVTLEQTGVFENSSVTTRDGRCSIRVVRISGDQVSLSVAVDANPAKLFERQLVGSRVSVDAGDAVYYIDLHRIRGDIIDLSVSRRRK